MSILSTLMGIVLLSIIGVIALVISVVVVALAVIRASIRTCEKIRKK